MARGVARLGRVEQALALLQDSDLRAAAGQAGGDRRAAHAGADDDDIGLSPWTSGSASSVAGSKNTVLVRLKVSGVTEPGWTLASARRRATTALPPRLVTAKVSEPAGSTTSMWQIGGGDA